jgi:hypothetical protein
MWCVMGIDVMAAARVHNILCVAAAAPYARVLPYMCNYYKVQYGAELIFRARNRCYSNQFINLNSTVVT